MTMSLVIWGIATYTAISLLIAYLSRVGPSSSMSDYFLGGRAMGGVVSALSYSATTYSAFMMVGLAGLTYRGGVGALGFEIIYFAGVSLVAVFGPRFWAVGRKYGFVTPYEMLGNRYGNRWVAFAAGLVSLVFLIPYSAVQLAGVGYLLAGMTDGGIPFGVGIVVATVLAIVFSYIAGIRSVMWTDSLQAVMMLLAAVLATGLVVSKLGGFQRNVQHFVRDTARNAAGAWRGLFQLHNLSGAYASMAVFLYFKPTSQPTLVHASLNRCAASNVTDFSVLWTDIHIGFRHLGFFSPCGDP